MNAKSAKLFMLLTLAVFSWSTASAEMNGGQILDATINSAVEGFFTESERQLISEYYRNHRQDNNYADKGKHKKKKGKKQKGLPPGLAKKQQLPPGLQKQLERNGTLPPGLAKRELPQDLESRLPPVPEGMERVIADTNVILVEKASGIIRDIIKDIVQ